jgi:hypothetical protein
MEHILEYDEENGFLRMRIPSDWKFNIREASSFLDLVEEYYAGRNRRYLIVDVSRSPGRSLSREFRIWMNEQATRIGFDKIGVVGVSPFNRMVAKIAIATMGKSRQTQFFKSEREAIRWLSVEDFVGASR